MLYALALDGGTGAHRLLIELAEKLEADLRVAGCPSVSRLPPGPRAPSLSAEKPP